VLSPLPSAALLSVLKAGEGDYAHVADGQLDVAVAAPSSPIAEVGADSDRSPYVSDIVSTNTFFIFYFIFAVYNDLPHPPTGFLAPPPLPQSRPPLPDSPNIHYAFRPADGSHYNRTNATLGMAGYPYARSVPSSHPLPPHSLPDPGLIFDTLLGRPNDPKSGKESFTPHPGGISALFFAFADLIIHSCFSTSLEDWRINSASSYLDLSILYGSSDDQVKSIRRKDGTGRLWEDVFADPRLLLMPPASCALLVLLSRNHNVRVLSPKSKTFNSSDSFKKN
jgi:hypothetical protein